MWAIQLPSGEFLDVPRNLSLSFELNNLVFSSSDSSVLPGSFSFPADLPLTERNKRLLDRPHLINNGRPRTPIEGVWVYGHNNSLFYGTLTIRGADRSRVRINITANPLQSLKKLPLNQLDLGGQREIGNAAAMLAHAKLTAENPLDYDYVFCPVLNHDFLGTPTADKRSFMQNHWNVDAQAFEVGHDYPALTPFPRISYLLQQIFARTEYTFQNRFQSANQFTSALLAYSNRSLWTAAGLPSFIDLRNHVSTTSSTDWLRKLMSNFGLAIFTNPWNKTMQLVPMRDVVLRGPVHDWTGYAVGELTIEEGTADVPDTFDYRIDDADAVHLYMTTRYPRPADDEVVASVHILEDLESIPAYASTEGIYYIESRAAYYYYKPLAILSERYRLRYSELGPAPGRTGSTFECLMPPLYDYWHYSDPWIDRPADMPQGNLPFCRIPGSVEYTPTGGDTVRQDSQHPDRLIWYRGMLQDIELQYYPMACSTPFLALGFQLNQYNARLQGPYGSYHWFLSPWHQVLKNGKHATQQFVLPVGQLVAFSFADCVHVGQMNYFLKRLRVQQLLPRGRVLVEASLVSVI